VSWPGLGEGSAGDADGEQAAEGQGYKLGFHTLLNPPILLEEPAFRHVGAGFLASFPEAKVRAGGMPFREVDGKEGRGMRKNAGSGWKSPENGPKKLEAGASASGVEDSRNRLPAGP